MEIKIKWIKRKQMTHENTYRDDTEKRGSYTIPTELEESTWRIKIRYISLELLSCQYQHVRDLFF